MKLLARLRRRLRSPEGGARPAGRREALTVSRPTRFEPALPKLVFMSLAALSLAAGGLLAARSRSREHARFERLSDELAQTISARVSHYVDAVRACGGLFDASAHVGREEFSRFVRSLDVARRYPGIQGLGWAEFAGAPRRAEIRFLEPQDAHNRSAMGKDMYAESLRRDAIERAVSTGKPAATGPVVLLQELGPEKKPGFLIYFPVYRRGEPVDTPARRRAAARGVVYAPFRSSDFFRLMRPPPELDFSVVDEPTKALLHAHGSTRGEVLRGERSIYVAGRAWKIDVAGAGLLSPYERWEGSLISMLGVLLACVLHRLLCESGRRARELREAVAARRESEARFRLVAEAAPSLIWMTGTDRGCVWLNRRWLAYTGRTLQQDLGFGWKDALHPEDCETALQSYMKAFDARTPFTLEFRLRRHDGVYRWHRNDGVPFEGAGGAFAGFIGSCVDVHESRELERELERRVAERTLELEAANRELESFAYSVSHDLRAPLRTIEGFSAVLVRRLGPKLDGEDAGHFKRIRAGVERMGCIIDDVLKLSRLTRLDPKLSLVDVTALARAAAQEAARHFPHPVALSIAEGMTATADPALLRLALDNLLANAYKYSSKTPGARVEVGRDSQAYFVRDNGAGFDMVHADKLFQPFSRLHTREEFEGTGVGLAIVKRIVERHGGRAWADSEVGKGAAFFFTLGEAA